MTTGQIIWVLREMWYASLIELEIAAPRRPKL